MAFSNGNQIVLTVSAALTREESMPLQTSLPESRHSRGTSQFRPKFAWAMGICAAILVYAVAIPGLRAQTASASAPADNSAQKPAAKCPVPPPPNEKTPSSDADYAAAALACEWLDTDKQDGTAHVLKAIELLTCSSQDPDVLTSGMCEVKIVENPAVFLQVLKELEAGVSKERDKAVYTWALGKPNEQGPTAAGMPNFIDALAKANTLTAGRKEKTKDEQDLAEDELFACTQKIIEGIYASSKGPLILPKINGYFSGNTYDRYLGLILLLEHVRGTDETAHANHVKCDPKSGVKCDADCDAKCDAQNLEELRAAFELDADRLGSQIAAKVSAPPKQ